MTKLEEHLNKNSSGGSASPCGNRFIACEDALRAAIAAINNHHPGALDPYVPPSPVGDPQILANFTLLGDEAQFAEVVEPEGDFIRLTLNDLGDRPRAYLNYGLHDNYSIDMDMRASAQHGIADIGFSRDSSGQGPLYRIGTGSYPNTFGAYENSNWETYNPYGGTTEGRSEDYQSTVPVDEWVHVRIEVSEGEARAYHNGLLYQTIPHTPEAGDTYLCLANEGDYRNIVIGGLVARSRLDLSAWTLIRGADYHIANNGSPEYISTASPAEGVAYYNLGLYDNYVIEAELLAGRQVGDLMFGRTVTGEGQYFRIAKANGFENGFGLTETTDWTTWTPSFDTLPNPLVVNVGDEWNKVRIVVQGGKATAYISDELVQEMDYNPGPDNTYIGFTDQGSIRNVYIQDLGIGDSGEVEDLTSEVLTFTFSTDKLDTAGKLTAEDITFDTNMSVGSYQGRTALIDTGNGHLRFNPAASIPLATGNEGLEVECSLFVPEITTRHIFLTMQLEGTALGYITLETSGWQNNMVSSYSSENTRFDAVSTTQWPVNEWAKFKYVISKSEDGGARTITIYLNDTPLAVTSGTIPVGDLRLAELTIGNWREGIYSVDSQAISDVVFRVLK